MTHCYVRLLRLTLPDGKVIRMPGIVPKLLG